MKPRSYRSFLFLLLISSSSQVIAQVKDQERQERFNKMSVENERKGLAEPFKGITKDGKVQEGLFELRSTGVSTAPVRHAAVAFLKSLDNEQRKRTQFSIDDDEWRKWMNQDFYVRQGVSFVEMSEKQRNTAFDLMKASLSAKGLTLLYHVTKFV